MNRNREIFFSLLHIVNAILVVVVAVLFVTRSIECRDLRADLSKWKKGCVDCEFDSRHKADELRASLNRIADEKEKSDKLADQRLKLIDLLTADLNAGRLYLADLAEGQECERRETREKVKRLEAEIARLEKENAEFRKRPKPVVYVCPQPVPVTHHRRKHR